jgi:VanZ family protein
VPSLTRALRIWLPPILWLGVIAWESFRLSSNVTGVWLYDLLSAAHISVSYPQFETLHHLLRKLGHFAGYGLLTLLFFRAWFYTLRREVSSTRFQLRCAALALIVTLLTAMADEWHQSFDLSRTGTSKDVALDMTGGITGQILAFGIYTSWKRNGERAVRVSGSEP